MGPSGVDVRIIPWLPLVQWPQSSLLGATMQPTLTAASLGLLHLQDSKLSPKKLPSFLSGPPDAKGRHLWLLNPSIPCPQPYVPPVAKSCCFFLSRVPLTFGFLEPPSRASCPCVLRVCHSTLLAVCCSAPASVNHTSGPKTASKGFALSCTVLFGETRLLLPDSQNPARLVCCLKLGLKLDETPPNRLPPLLPFTHTVIQENKTLPSYWKCLDFPASWPLLKPVC